MDSRTVLSPWEKLFSKRRALFQSKFSHREKALFSEKSFSVFPRLLSHSDFFQLLSQVVTALEHEDASWRPEDSCGRPGGLVDLVSQVPQLPTIIVPDLHSRWQFFQAILNFMPDFPGDTWDSFDGTASVAELLAQGKVNVVCVGDGLHSELHRERWQRALAEYEGGQVLGGALEAEMTEGLFLMELVMRCKVAFPRNFHFLKGNHENITNQWAGGDRPFRKLAREGEMSRRFMEEQYGEDVLYLYSHFESLLPLCVVAPRCLVSHSEPVRSFSRQDIVEALADETGEVVHGLTWTRNDESQEGTVAAMLQELLPQWWGQEEGVESLLGKNPFSALYFGGHRSISESYRLRQGGRFVQLHNPRLHQVALVFPHRPFDFIKDFIRLDNQEE